MNTIERPFEPYTIDDFTRYIHDEAELKTLKDWLDTKNNLNLDIFETPISFRFEIKIEINSALDRTYVIDKLDRTVVELTDWGNF